MKYRLGPANEVLGEAANLATVQDVHHPQLLNGRGAELSQGYVHQLLLVQLGQTPPASAGRIGTQQRNVAALAVHAGSREDTLFHRVHKIQAGIGPDVRNGNRRKQEHRSAVRRQTDSRSHHFLHVIRGEEGQRRFILMLSEPRRPP